MGAFRDVWVTIGKQSYSVETSLDSDAVERIEELITAACGSPAKGVNQEELLVLTCLQLAYSLDKAAEDLERLLEPLE